MLIATPIVLSVINNSKTSSSEKNVEMYLNAVELSLANNLMKESGKSGINGQYQINDLVNINNMFINCGIDKVILN